FLTGDTYTVGRADLERALGPFMQILREQSAPQPLSAVRFLGDAPRTVSPAERMFLGRFRKGEVQPIELLWHAPERGAEPTGLALLVRQSACQLRVVGVAARR